MPGDCSPSRSVVSKIRTRCASSLLMSFLSLPRLRSPRWSRGYAPPSAIPPEGGGGEVAGRAGTTSSYSLQRQDNLADVAPLVDEAVRVGALLEWESLGHSGPDRPAA